MLNCHYGGAISASLRTHYLEGYMSSSSKTIQPDDGDEGTFGVDNSGDLTATPGGTGVGIDLTNGDLTYKSGWGAMPVDLGPNDQ